jgi:selenocysteine-specific elongation factor
MTVVVGTAGHIDHGKTSLLRALTGIDADRLPEERRRGMTIDVGYAHLRLPDDDELDFVDVPGHDQLVGNMLVGAGEVDAALLVVAADDGPRAQTIEHLELLDALGLDVGVVAVTKIDLVEPARVEAVVAAVADLLRTTTLAGSPIVPVSSSRGDGLGALLLELVRLRDRVRAGTAAIATGLDESAHGARLATDRSFTVHGRGLVVTGSLRGGGLRRGATLRLEPGGRSVRVREVQVHGSSVDAVDGGGRVALNLVGDIEPPPSRGDVVTDDTRVRGASELLVVLRRSAILGMPTDRGTSWPPAPGAVVRIHLGTAAVDARPGRGRRDVADLPDGRRIVRLRLDHPIAAAIGDRFVVRRSSPGGTIAGGVVLDVRPPVGPSRRRSDPERLAALVDGPDRAPGAIEARLELHGILPVDEPVVGGSRSAERPVLGGHLLAADVEAELERMTIAHVDAGRDAGISLAETRLLVARELRRRVTVDRRAVDRVAGAIVERLVADRRLMRDSDQLRAPGRAVGGIAPEVAAAMDRLVLALSVATPPSLTAAALTVGCPVTGIRALEAAGQIVRLDGDLAYAAGTFAALATTALRLAETGPIAPAAFRDATGTSRKYVMAILEELDRRGVLRRTPAGHVPGPRAATAVGSGV